MRITQLETIGNEPVTLNEVRDHLRIIGEDENETLRRAMIAAREYVEEYTGKRLVETKYRVTFDGFMSRIPLTQIPIAEVEKVEYVNPDGDTVEFEDWRLVQSDVAAFIVPTFGSHWPATRGDYDVVTVEYRAGHNGSNVPKRIKQAILLLVGDLYENRENNVIGTSVARLPTADALLYSYRRMEV